MDRARLKVTILGCGSSGGVPRVGGDWGACDPHEPKNRRTRCGLLVERWTAEGLGPTVVLIDTSPDLREQLLAARVTRVDGVLFTHDHADQAHGIDDLRPLAIMARRQVPVFMDAPTRKALTHRFGYCFYGEGGYPAILKDAGVLEDGAPVTIEGPGGPIHALPILQDHGGRPSLGFRIGPFGYSNDVVQLSDAALAELQGLELWIVDALRYAPHPTHAHLARTLEWIARIKPQRAILTNLHVDLDYRRLQAETPDTVEPAYDGWSAELYL